MTMNDTTTPVRPQPLNADTGATGETPAPGGIKAATQTLKDEAGKLTRTATDKARVYAGDGKAKASGALGEVARLVDDAANTVDEKLGSEYGQYAHSAAKAVGGFADTLNNKNVDELLEDARSFVRKSPMVAVGIAAAVGFAVARIVKAGIDSAADAAEGSRGGNDTDR